MTYNKELYHNSHSLGSLGSCRILSINRLMDKILHDFKDPKLWEYPAPPKGPLIEPLWPLIVGVWGKLEGSWGV